MLVAVLGAGLQGVSVALALSKRGFNVTLIEQAEDALLRASLRNEGKIHLGLVYAADRSNNTSELMLRSAFNFAPLLETWLGKKINWSELLSRPFVYLIPKDTMIQPESLFESYQKMQQSYQEQILKQPELHYLGQRPERIWQKLELSKLDFELNREQVIAAVQTAEYSLKLEDFSKLLRAAIQNEKKIGCNFGKQIKSIQRKSFGFCLEGIDLQGKNWTQDVGAVVNCLWDGRLSLDQQLDLLPKRPWVYRLKFRLLGKLASKYQNLPSLTLVLGPYGDIVVTPGSDTYFSWYPACLKGWSEEINIPEHWQSSCRGQVGVELANEISNKSLSGFEQYLPGIRASQIKTVDAGVIFSWGKSDINDPVSELHQRYDVGVHAHDGYFSIDTGKLTCAPLFAQNLEQHFL